MRRRDAFPSTYLSHEDLDKPIDAVIDRVEMELVGQDADKSKPVLYFKGQTKPLVLNHTNWDTLEDAYGDSDNWPGKTLTLFRDKTQYQGKTVFCIRVRVIATVF